MYFTLIDMAQIYLLYILANNSLAIQMFLPGFGWTSAGNGGAEFTDISAFTARTNSRYLSISLLPGAGVIEACVLFEGANNNISAIHGMFQLEPGGWIWKDISDSLNPNFINGTLQGEEKIPASMRSTYLMNATLDGPFTGGIAWNQAFGGMIGAPPEFDSPFLSVLYLYRNSSTTYLMSARYSTVVFVGSELRSSLH